MQLFWTAPDADAAAEQYLPCHACKIPTEALQLLFAAMKQHPGWYESVETPTAQWKGHAECPIDKDWRCKVSYRRHPLTFWTGCCRAHFRACLALGLALARKWERDENYAERNMEFLTRLKLEELERQIEATGFPADMPEKLSPDDWEARVRELMPEKKAGEWIAKTATRDVPTGCRFGYCAMDKKHLVRDTNGVMCVASYRRLYEAKRADLANNPINRKRARK